MASGRRVAAVRNNDRILHDDTALATELYGRVAPHMPIVHDRVPVGLNERFRFYRYGPGQRFAHHTDGYFERGEERSRFTFMVYLNDDFTGGETSFGRLNVRPEVGMALVFRHELEHEGSALIAGSKYVLRSDVMYRGP